MAFVVSELEKPVNRPASKGVLALRLSPVFVVLLLWAAQFAYFTVDRLARNPSGEGLPNLLARMIVTFIGVGLSLAIMVALQRSSHRTLLQRAFLALALALAAAAFHSVANMAVFAAIVGPGPEDRLTTSYLREALPPLIYFFSWVHLAIGLVLLSLVYDRELADARAGSRAASPGDPKAADDTHIWVRKGAELVRIDASAIDWISAEGECARLHSGKQSYLERTTIGALAEQLRPSGFLRIHRSTIVNPARIESIARTQWGSLELRLDSGPQLRVSKSYQPAVRKLLQRGGEVEAG